MNKNKTTKIATFFMMLPAVLMLAVCSIYPFLWIFRYVCYEYNGMTSYYTGAHNFLRMLQDATFFRSVGHTFEYAALKLVFIVPLALIMAVLMNQKIRGSGLFRGIYFMPTIISTAVSALVFSFIFAAYNGVLNAVLRSLGVIGQNVNWLGDAKVAMWSVIIVAVWGGFGNYMIYFMSGMAGISEDVYESAKIDGANGIQTFFRITLPMLSPMLKVILMLAITGAFKDYESIMVLTDGGPNSRTQVMFLYIYQLIFGATDTATPQIGYGTVLSLAAALIVGIVTAVYLFFARKLDDVV
ncbi:MAG: sugar ABC transporter permease [Eubacteriales bacterium]|nr:sugar ABC transporter permease [Eubacteriales bacterium]